MRFHPGASGATPAQRRVLTALKPKGRCLVRLLGGRGMPDRWVVEDDDERVILMVDTKAANALALVRNDGLVEPHVSGVSWTIAEAGRAALRRGEGKG